MKDHLKVKSQNPETEDSIQDAHFVTEAVKIEILPIVKLKQERNKNLNIDLMKDHV